MKRLFALLLVCTMIIGSACATDIDLSSMSFDELIDLSNRIQAMLFTKQLVDGVSVPPGTYIIGEDIPAGTYRIEITGGTGYYDIRETSDGKLISTGLTGKSYNVVEIGKIIFNDGNELKLVNSTFVLFPYTGLFH